MAYEGKRFKATGEGASSGASAAPHGTRFAAPVSAAAPASGRRSRTGAPADAAPASSYAGKRFTKPASCVEPAVPRGARFAKPAPATSASAEVTQVVPAQAPDTTVAVPRMASAAASAVQSALPARRHHGGGPQGPRGRGGSAGNAQPPERKRSASDIISKVLIIIGILLLLLAAGIFIAAQMGYRKAGETYDSLSQYVRLTDADGDGVPIIDWDALKAINEDIVAWIYIPGTNISYPVVQGETNDEYLRTLPDGTWNNNGSIMLDADQAEPGMVGQQTTVYGHHMTDGSMFDPIEQSLDQAVFDTFTKVYYLTPEMNYETVPLYTARVPDTYVQARQEDFGAPEDLRAYLAELHENAHAEMADLDGDFDEVGQVLTLVTCSGMAPADHRAIMVCNVIDAYEPPAAAPEA